MNIMSIAIPSVISLLHVRLSRVIKIVLIYLLTYLLTYNGKNAFKTFPDPESEADDFKKTTVTYLSKDTSLVTFS